MTQQGEESKKDNRAYVHRYMTRIAQAASKKLGCELIPVEIKSHDLYDRPKPPSHLFDWHGCNVNVSYDASLSEEANDAENESGDSLYHWYARYDNRLPAPDKKAAFPYKVHHSQWRSMPEPGRPSKLTDRWSVMYFVLVYDDPMILVSLLLFVMAGVSMHVANSLHPFYGPTKRNMQCAALRLVDLFCVSLLVTAGRLALQIMNAQHSEIALFHPVMDGLVCVSVCFVSACVYLLYALFEM